MSDEDGFSYGFTVAWDEEKHGRMPNRPQLREEFEDEFSEKIEVGDIEFGSPGADMGAAATIALVVVNSITVLFKIHEYAVDRDGAYLAKVHGTETLNVIHVEEGADVGEIA